MKIRYGEDKDFEKAKKIWLECFTDSQEEVDFYFSTLYNKNNYLLLEEQNDILASLHENKFNLIINGEEVPSFYIVGVAVSPQFRNKGYMKEIIKSSLQGAKEKGYEFVYLCPINSKLYRRYGFDYILDIEKYKFDMNELPTGGIDKNIVIKKLEVHLIDEYICDLMDIYREKMKDFLLSVKRDKKTFKKLLQEVISDNGEIYIFYRDNMPIGYTIFYKDEKIHIREIFGKDKNSIINILRFIKTFREYYPQVEINTPEREHLNFYLDNQEQIENEITPFIMGRIIDPIKLFKRVIDSKINLRLKINDEIIDKNNGVYIFDGKGNITFKKAEQWDMSIDIGSLAQLLFGYCTLQELIFREKVIFSNEEIINALKNKNIFALSKNYIQDYQ